MAAVSIKQPGLFQIVEVIAFRIIKQNRQISLVEQHCNVIIFLNFPPDRLVKLAGMEIDRLVFSVYAEEWIEQLKFRIDRPYFKVYLV